MSKHKHAPAPDPLIPAHTPFSYNVGINYESWEVGRTGYSITADLDQIAQNFHLIRTYHAAGVGTADPTKPTIDATQDAVINWIVKHPGNELVMGTANSALANGGYGKPWSAGLMTDSAYTDLWVKMLIKAFGSVEKVKIGLKAIELGNELDQNGPAPTSSSFSDYVNTWIPEAFDNLKASMAKYGLGSIPISTTIANYGTTNEVSVKIPAYIAAHWATTWNDGEPFVAFNQYTQDGMKSTNFATVEAYFESVEKALGGKLEVFVGETGYSTYWGASKQATVYKQIVDWLGTQRDHGGKTVPLFVFDAFDRPAVTYPADEAQVRDLRREQSFAADRPQDRPGRRHPKLDEQDDQRRVIGVRLALRHPQGRDHQGAWRRRHRAGVAPATTGWSGRPGPICWSDFREAMCCAADVATISSTAVAARTFCAAGPATIRWSAASTGTSCRAERARTSSSSISR